jgi:hypothetical protein
LLALERIRWEEVDIGGKLDHPYTIATYRRLHYGVSSVAGVSFTYTSGTARTIGSTDGRSGCSVSVADNNDHIAGVELIMGRFGLLDITVSASYDTSPVFRTDHIL